MSMLAERKRRQKWSLNPRGKDWSEDQNKFGQKMLEKMGWSKGKGLGFNLHGVTEHVRVSYKNDQNGIGYKARDDQWTEHQDGFNSLLENLAAAGSNGAKEGETKFKSLEEKSKVSKARVHYAKFTRGKDLSRASAKDLANIFGKKTLVSKAEQPKSVEEQEESFTKNGGSMFDYFKKKLPGFGKNAEGYVVGSNGVLKKDSDSEDEFRGGFGFKAENNRAGFGSEENSFTNSAFDPFVTKVDVKKHVLIPIEEHEEENAEGNRSGEDEKRKKSSKRNSNSETIEEVNRKNLDREERTCFEEETGIVDENDNATCDGSKINNNAFEVSRKKKRKRTEQVENPYEVVRKDKKKKKKSRVTDVMQETPEKMAIKKKNESIEETHLNENPCFEEETGIVDEADNVTCDDSKISNNAFEVSRKKKKGMPLEQAENPYEVVRKDKKKKKKNRIADVTQETPEKKNESIEETHSSENPCFEEENGIIDEDVNATGDDSKINNNAFEVSRKKKKKIPDEQVENSYEVVRKDKKKKKKSRVADVTLETLEKMVVKKKNQSIEETNLNENPCFEEENGIVDENVNQTCDDSKINNNAFEVSRKKKKKRSLDNPTFTEDCPDLQDNNTFEVPRKVKKNKASSVELEETSGSRKRKRKTNLDNAIEDDSKNDSALQVPKKAKKDKEIKDDIEESDLMLNVTATPTTVPILKSSSSSTATKRRRSVRFSAVNEERTIPNLDDLAKNELFDINARVIEKGMVDRRMEAYRKKIEQAQAELENEMNQAKMEAEKFIGETETTEGEAEKLPDGHTKLKFKDAKFHNFAGWGKRDATSRAKAAYKKQIIGDVVVQFNNTNLHEIKGYASQPVRRKF